MRKRRTEVCKSSWTIRTSKYVFLYTIHLSNTKLLLELLAIIIFFTNKREMAELHKANAAKNSEAQQVALSAEMQAKEELRLALERQQVQSKQDQEALVTQVKYEYNIVFETAKTKNITPLGND